MQTLFEIKNATWDKAFTAGLSQAATSALEEGSVLVLSGLAFGLNADESKLLDPRILSKSKNVSYTPWTGRLGGTSCVGAEAEVLRGAISRYSASAHALMKALIPYYSPALKLGRTSFRPAEIAGRHTSWRKDDTRLHVDAFPSAPTYGERIIRVFCNVNPSGRPRIWRLGEPFEDVARRFLPRIRPPFPGSARLMHLFRITKRPRSAYDHYMLGLHDAMKSDTDYQGSVGLEPVPFVPGTTWITFSDSVSHAALSGQHQFEQTFNLPETGMLDGKRSPLQILGRLLERKLA